MKKLLNSALLYRIGSIPMMIALYLFTNVMSLFWNIVYDRQRQPRGAQAPAGGNE